MDILKFEDYCRCLECGRMSLKVESLKVNLVLDEETQEVMWSGDWVCPRCSSTYVDQDNN